MAEKKGAWGAALARKARSARTDKKESGTDGPAVVPPEPLTPPAAVLAPAVYGTAAIADLFESPLNPRKSWDAQELAELTASVKAVGILEPILVRPVKGRFEIIAGARRYRAAKAAGLAEVPIRTLDGLTDAQAIELMIVENLQRKDLEPLEEAQGFARLIKEARWDVKQLAGKIGKSIGYVYARLKLVETLEPLAMKALAEKKIEAGHAILLARLEPKLQVEALKSIREDTTVAHLAGWIQREIHRSLSAAPWKWDDAELLPEAGPCTACPFRSSKEKYPDLKENTCLKPSCYEAKILAFASRKAKEDGLTAVKIHSRMRQYARPPIPKDDKAAGEWQFIRNGKPCDARRLGVVMDQGGVYDDAKGKRLESGEAADVCVDPKGCAVHRPPRSSSGAEKKSPARIAADKKAFEKERHEKAVRERLLEETLKKVSLKDAKTLRAHLEIAALKFFEDIWAEYRKQICNRRGWGGEAKGTKGRGGNYEELAAANLPKLSDVEILGFLVELSVVKTMGGKPGYGYGRSRWTDDLAVAAKLHGLTPAGIEKIVATEEKAAVKAKAKPKPRVVPPALKKHQKRG